MAREDLRQRLTELFPQLDEDKLEKAVRTLFDGKWRWGEDLAAIGTILMSAGGLVTAIVALLAAKGVL